jgi:hypothetical protein
MAPPPASSSASWRQRGERLVAAFLQPLVLVRRLREQPVAWRAYLRIVVAQSALTLVLGSASFVYHLPEDRKASGPVAEARQELDDARRARTEAKKALEQASAARRAVSPETRAELGAALDAAKARVAEATAGAGAAAERLGASEELKRARAEVKMALAQARVARSALPPEAKAALASVLEEAQGQLAALEAAAVQVEAAAPAALEETAKAGQALAAEAQAGLASALEGAQASVEAATERLQDSQEEEQAAAAKLKAAEAEATLSWWKTLGLWLSSLVVAQWVVLGLSRDYQDRVARDLSLVAGLQPEDLPPASTRVRVDVKWLKRKLRRKVRGALAVGAGVVMLSPLIAGGAVLGHQEEASSAVVALVSAYWWVVFTAARSARAWRLEDLRLPPRPLQVLFEAPETVPLLRWWLPRLAVRFARWATWAVWAPARAIEADFAGFAGLGLARLVATLPLVRIALRAPVVVAAGAALEASADIDLGPAPALAPALAPRLEELGAAAPPRSSEVLSSAS